MSSQSNPSTATNVLAYLTWRMSTLQNWRMAYGSTLASITTIMWCINCTIYSFVNESICLKTFYFFVGISKLEFLFRGFNGNFAPPIVH